MTVDITKHLLVPKHSKVSEAEHKKLLEKYSISPRQLPKILKNDPAIIKLGVKAGDIIKVERDSKTAGTFFHYRFVIEG
ncbi:MAG TPA: DNA-directed RNA polymerase subunit H [Candidatus Nanoarchaeia archaeon]|nr:DNA-directed RNA polymerase subunit H [Candidatus Nanoarchaeia archaeon]